MNKFTVISQIIGVASAGAMLYDANEHGVHSSKKAHVSSIANRLPDEYVASTRMENSSAITNGLKKRFFKWQLDDGIPEFFAGINGYFKGTADSLTENVIPAGLATGAILFKNVAGRFCAVGLGIIGVKYLLYDVFGIGKPKILKDDL